MYMYKLAKTTEVKTSVLNCVKYIKNENQRVSLRKKKIRKRWDSFFFFWVNLSMKPIHDIGVN